jgi:NADPH:quinone reductase and related Zn-dependent oxidoreductases
MKAIVLRGVNEIFVEEVPIPVPGNGEVLVKIEAAPINPSDLAFLIGSIQHRQATASNSRI